MNGSGAGVRERDEGDIFSSLESARTKYRGQEGKIGRELAGQVQGKGKTTPLIEGVWYYGEA